MGGSETHRRYYGHEEIQRSEVSFTPNETYFACGPAKHGSQPFVLEEVLNALLGDILARGLLLSSVLSTGGLCCTYR